MLFANWFSKAARKSLSFPESVRGQTPAKVTRDSVTGLCRALLNFETRSMTYDKALANGHVGAQDLLKLGLPTGHTTRS